MRSVALGLLVALVLIAGGAAVWLWSLDRAKTAEISQMRAESEKLRNEVDGLQAQIGKLKSANGDLTRSVEKLRNENGTLQADNRKLQDEAAHQRAASANPATVDNEARTELTRMQATFGPAKPASQAPAPNKPVSAKPAVRPEIKPDMLVAKQPTPPPRPVHKAARPQNRPAKKAHIGRRPAAHPQAYRAPRHRPPHPLRAEELPLTKGLIAGSKVGPGGEFSACKPVTC